METPKSYSEEVVLHSDNGLSLHFKGRLFSESSYFDNASETLTRLRLFVMEDGGQVYSIVSSQGNNKSRRHYILRPHQDVCEISDGIQALTVPIEMLFAAVFGLCGIDPSQAETLRSSFDDTLFAVNA